MTSDSYRHIYGPVSSWRLGRSLGVDLLGGEKKRCNMDCVYCQLGRTRQYVSERDVFVSSQEVLRELTALWPIIEVDMITFSGMGEPTLAKNLGEVIEGSRCLKGAKRAVITNGSLLYWEEVRQDLSKADVVLVKLDAATEGDFNLICKPERSDTWKNVLDGIIQFRREFSGRMIVQSMFIQANLFKATALAELVSRLSIEEIEINTPLRACGVKALDQGVVRAIAAQFSIKKVSTVYDERLIRQKSVIPLESKATKRRRGTDRALARN